jgi:hypothetical protein
MNTNILINNGIDNYPAAKACIEYSTTYSPAGTWYLPAIGELCYLLSRWYTIQQTLYMINNTKSISQYAQVIDNNNVYWSSSYAFYIELSYGLIT